MKNKCILTIGGKCAPGNRGYGFDSWKEAKSVADGVATELLELYDEADTLVMYLYLAAKASEGRYTMPKNPTEVGRIVSDKLVWEFFVSE